MSDKPPDYTMINNLSSSSDYDHILNDLYEKWQTEDQVLVAKYDQLRQLVFQSKEQQLVKIHHETEQKIQSLTKLQQREQKKILRRRQTQVTQIMTPSRYIHQDSLVDWFSSWMTSK